MGISLMANGALESLRDRVAFPIKAASHWNSTKPFVNLIPLWHCTWTSFPGRPPWGRQGNPWDVSLHLASIQHCVLMVKTSYLNEFYPLFTFMQKNTT